jgi:hypothetical protein
MLHQTPSRHQRDSLLVQKVAMLDAPHSGSDGLLHRPRRVRVHHHIGAPVLRGVDRGAQLGFGVLRDIERVIRRSHPAAGHHLHLAGAQHQLLA